MEKNEARIRVVIVGVDRPDFVHFIYNRRFDLPRFNKVGSGNQPIGFIAHGIFCHQLVEGLTLLLGFRVKSVPDKCIWRSMAPAPPLPALLSNQRLPVTTML